MEEGRSIDRQRKGLERGMAKRGRLVQRKDEINRKIRDIGVLPDEAFGKYTQMKSDAVSSPSYAFIACQNKYGLNNI